MNRQPISAIHERLGVAKKKISDLTGIPAATVMEYST